VVSPRSGHPGPPASRGAAFASKKNETLTDQALGIFSQQSAAASSPRAAQTLLRHLVSHVVCQERHTVTGLLTTAGRLDADWTADYRLYTSQVEQRELFRPILDGILDLLRPDDPLVVAVDDSLLPKTGSSIPGSGWYKDPLGPGFNVNLVRGLKFVQLSAAVPDPANAKRARMIPIALSVIPKLPKLPVDASDEERRDYEKRKNRNSPAAHAVRLLRELRQHLDQRDTQAHRVIWVCGDGNYTTSTLIPKLPARTRYIGRTRGDTHLHAPADPPNAPGRGRPRSYGEKLPTPEELRKDKAVPWHHFTIQKAGSVTQLRYKHIAKAKWHKAGERKTLQVIVIAPMRFKRRKNGQWRYTKPTYILSTDTKMPVEQLIQAYFWRWDIEVNFRDEKQLFGAAHPQVRHPESVRCAPAVCIAAYAGLLLAALRVYGLNASASTIRAPKWYPTKKKPRATTSDLRKQVQHELAARSLHFADFSDFASEIQATPKPTKIQRHKQAPVKRFVA
jgi:hypothetical protein